MENKTKTLFTKQYTYPELTVIMNNIEFIYRPDFEGKYTSFDSKTNDRFTRIMLKIKKKVKAVQEDIEELKKLHCVPSDNGEGFKTEPGTNMLMFKTPENKEIYIETFNSITMIKHDLEFIQIDYDNVSETIKNVLIITELVELEVITEPSE